MYRYIYSVIYLTVLFIFCSDAALPNYIGTPDHDCIACLCFVRTQCFILPICANYTINQEYWERAGAPTVTTNSEVNEKSYRECMTNDNCILNTIQRHMQTYDEEDCVCDDEIDCRDKLSLYLFGPSCRQVMPKQHGVRYNYCARIKNLPLLDPNVECVNAIV